MEFSQAVAFHVLGIDTHILKFQYVVDNLVIVGIPLQLFDHVGVPGKYNWEALKINL